MNDSNPCQPPASRVDRAGLPASQRTRWMLAVMVWLLCLVELAPAADSIITTGHIDAGMAPSLFELACMTTGAVLLVGWPRRAKWAFLGALLLDVASWWLVGATPGLLQSFFAFTVSAFVLEYPDDTAGTRPG